MTTITTRAGKGSQLTNDEVDANFNNLNNDKAEVGANSDITSLDALTSINGNAPASNDLIINSFLDVKQRGAIDTAGYLYDRFIQSAGVTNTAWTADKLFDICFQLNASGDYIEQRVERANVRRRYDTAKSFVISAYLDVATGGNLSVIIDYPTAVDNYGAVTNVVTDTFAVAVGTSRLVRPVTLPDAAFTYGARVRLQSGGAACKVVGLKFERGTVVTPPEFWKIGLEVAQCQRYFEPIPTTYSSATPLYTYSFFKVAKRAQPTLVPRTALPTGATLGAGPFPTAAFRLESATSAGALDCIVDVISEL